MSDFWTLERVRALIVLRRRLGNRGGSGSAEFASLGEWPGEYSYVRLSPLGFRVEADGRTGGRPCGSFGNVIQSWSTCSVPAWQCWGCLRR